MSDDDASPDDQLTQAGERADHLRVLRDERPDGTDAPGVTTVVIDRPDARNALNAAVRAELQTVFDAIADAGTEADEDSSSLPSVRTVVLTGADDAKAFVAGADVTELRERGVVDQRGASRRPRVYEAVADCPVPVVARVNGHALGGGCELAQACDLRIAREDAKIGQPEIGLGIMPGGGGTQRLPRLVGLGQAMRLVLTGELVDAEEASEIGLIDEAVGAERLDGAVYDLAESIAANPPIAVRHATEALRASQRRDLDAGLDYERELFVELFATEDKDEGIDAFLDGRDPEWQGR
ncbi:enoyl-CoA hydratase/isomerase family protein [Salinirubrum litoreum]|uniref:Enoyl-CoA hydratase/isomerase family protein n=1 Tax=Salinirubrum litoreum TaxID=1126234 RepID=A0ABD5R994_9EURY|nr:enoyl-CoA hydratase-related protein [Salinirubrum litoreum]